MGIEDAHLAHKAIELYNHTELFGKGEKAKELSDIVKQHALAATGAALIPVPILDIVAMAGNTWMMYVRINNALGISFGENALKSISSGILGNLASALPAAALGLVADNLLKLIPGFGTIGGIAIGVATNVAILYVAGKVYIKALEVMLHTGQPLTEENLKQAASKVTKDKQFVKEAYAEGKHTGQTDPGTGDQKS